MLERIFSAILLKIFNPLIGLSLSTDFGGNTFGTGVIASTFQMLGHSPRFRHAFSICVRGVLKCPENLLTILADISSGGVDGLVFISFMKDSTSFSLKYGIDSSSIIGISISSFLIVS